jgi:phosphoglycerate dehydrogenase-like enzyme
VTNAPLIVAPALIRPLAEPLLPPGANIRWFMSHDEALALAPDADICWIDAFDPRTRAEGVPLATKARWVHTLLAGLDDLPLAQLAAQGTLLTYGRGLNSANIADFALMGMLALAKGLAPIVRAHDRQEWLTAIPSTFELEGTRALIIGFGEIGQAIAARLVPFGVTCTGVRRHADPALDVLGMTEWRAHLPHTDWLILAAPGTAETRGMIGADELAALPRGARLINIARGELVDQSALIAALESAQLAGAFLDVTEPEPLLPEHPLWAAPNCLISMHMAGRSQQSMFRKGAERFARNLNAYLAGAPLEGLADLAKGY